MNEPIIQFVPKPEPPPPRKVAYFRTPKEARKAFAEDLYLDQRWRDIIEPVLKEREEQIAGNRPS